MDESHCASVHSTKPTTGCYQYRLIILLIYLVQHVPLLMVLVSWPCPATQMLSNFHFSSGQLLNGQSQGSMKRWWKDGLHLIITLLISQPETKANCRRFSQWAPFSIVFCHDMPAVTGSVPIAGIKPKNRRYDTHRQLLLVLKVRLTCHMRVWAAKLYNGFIIELHTLAIQVEASFLGEHIALRKLSLLLTFNLCNFDCCKL